ncbi:uncharacterized protein BDZ83DRAFT_282966 [Colletotrichum acutatum]|uniref:Secreted protein n=1 Tax=Glomerella acutata TaxID=27357 RepID=A0AAD8XFU7_GLOAC|nr:uncharacterized protein BDZ83DRAFT_282966 [Colletotrichum acutatum]KAK1725787.1 hypothetical protein BDZ83DRAFT_282966 [Colletotrichum acutatum]
MPFPLVFSCFFFFFPSSRVSRQPGPTMIDGLASAENPEKRECFGDFRNPFTSQLTLSVLKVIRGREGRSHGGWESHRSSVHLGRWIPARPGRLGRRASPLHSRENDKCPRAPVEKALIVKWDPGRLGSFAEDERGK